MAERAEAVGYDALWVPEHLLRAPLIYDVSFLSPLTVLAHVAARTSRIRLGTAILVLPLRQPVVLAKELATLDALAGGRLVLGVGTGWDAAEFEAAGVPLRERAGRTDECLALLRRLLTETGVTFSGTYYRVRDVTIDPQPPRVPEIWVGGGSKIADPAAADRPRMASSVLDRIRREADVWVTRPTDQALILADLAVVRAACAERERAGRPLGVAHFNFVHVVDTDDREAALRVQRPLFERLMGTHRPWAALEASYLMGTPAEIVAKLERLQRAGVAHFILAPLVADLAQVELIDARVGRPLRDAARAEMEQAHARR
jgi:probable F420-dependent oxidoreductase